MHYYLSLCYETIYSLCTLWGEHLLFIHKRNNCRAGQGSSQRAVVRLLCARKYALYYCGLNKIPTNNMAAYSYCRTAVEYLVSLFLSSFSLLFPFFLFLWSFFSVRGRVHTSHDKYGIVYIIDPSGFPLLLSLELVMLFYSRQMKCISFHIVSYCELFCIVLCVL